MDTVDTQRTDAAHETVHIVVVEHRVHAAHTIDITQEHTVLYLARIVQRGAVLVIATQQVEGSHGCEQLHGGGRAERLFGTIGIDGGVGRKVVDHQSQLCTFEQGIQHERIEARLDTIGLRLQADKRAPHKNQR